MAWITTDTDVACSLVVLKHVNGQTIPGYPKSYSILDSFGAYPAITVNEWHKMLITPRNQRIAAFKTYVRSVEGVNVDATLINEPYRPSTEPAGILVEG